MSKDNLFLPDIFIGGFPKCGTTSLFGWLSDHPSIQCSNVKETNFLVDPSWGPGSFNPNHNVINGLNGFEYFYSSTDNSKLKLEGSPTHAYSETARKTIKAMKHKPKVIFILREPSKQLFSYFNFFKNNKETISSDMSFFDWIECERKKNTFCRAFYVDYLKLWKRDLDPGQVKVYLFEDLVGNSQEFMKKVCFDLEIDYSFYTNYSFVGENPSFIIKNRFLNKLVTGRGLFIRRMIPNKYKRLFKSLYVKLNTQKHISKSREEDSFLKTLREEFREKNMELAHEFGLDLSSWD